MSAATYAELHSVAVSAMRSERRKITLSPTVLLHEVLLRYFRSRIPGSNELPAKPLLFVIMRNLLTDFARRRSSHAKYVAAAGEAPPSAPSPATAYRVQAAIRKLAELDRRQAAIVELRILAGFSNEEIADRLGCCARTVIREWRSAQLWLRRELGASWKGDEANER